MPLLFCNVGWMERYQGLRRADSIIGGGSYVDEHGSGHEVCNFLAHRGVVYGYVQVPGSQIAIERLGATPEADSVGGVTVVWTATRPTKGTAVVGWYKNATVYRHYQEHGSPPRSHKKGGIDGYWITTTEANATLLSVDERTCEIPRQSKGGMGRANIWYADSPASAPVLRRVQSFIGGKRLVAPSGGGKRGEQDQERKVAVEKAAVRVACDHFESLGYTVTSVEKDNLGWDLEARAGKSTLRIEVKGLSGNAFAVELTPNEFSVFSSKAADYRLAVVVSALDNPALSICRYSAETGSWVVDGSSGSHLEIEIRQSAAIKCV